MATNDIFMLKDKQKAVGSNEEILNIYFFRQTSALGTALGLAQAFDEDWLPLITDIQASGIQHTQIEVVNLFTVDDFGTVSFSDNARQGAWTEDMLPVFNAVTFRLVRTSRDIRNGYKRIAGVPEAAQDNGLITDTEYIAECNLVADAMREGVALATDSQAWEHVVVKRNRTGEGTVSDPYKYTLPQTQEEATYSNPSAVLVNLFMRHQVSRGN